MPAPVSTRRRRRESLSRRVRGDGNRDGIQNRSHSKHLKVTCFSTRLARTRPSVHWEYPLGGRPFSAFDIYRGLIRDFVSDFMSAFASPPRVKGESHRQRPVKCPSNATLRALFRERWKTQAQSQPSQDR